MDAYASGPIDAGPEARRHSSTPAARKCDSLPAVERDKAHRGPPRSASRHTTRTRSRRTGPPGATASKRPTLQTSGVGPVACKATLSANTLAPAQLSSLWLPVNGAPCVTPTASDAYTAQPWLHPEAAVAQRPRPLAGGNCRLTRAWTPSGDAPPVEEVTSKHVTHQWKR